MPKYVKGKKEVLYTGECEHCGQEKWLYSKYENIKTAQCPYCLHSIKLTKVICELIIKSLYDAQAECTCGKWWFIATGERSKKEIEHEWKKHL